jgi:hypothetical protein
MQITGLTKTQLAATLIQGPLGSNMTQVTQEIYNFYKDEPFCSATSATKIAAQCSF